MQLGTLRFRSGAAVVGCALSFCSPAFAEGDRFAYSQKLGLEVLTRASGDAWCASRVEFDIVAQNTSVFKSNDFHKLASALGRLVESRCANVKTLSLNGRGKQPTDPSMTAILGREDGWRWRGLNTKTPKQAAVSLDAPITPVTRVKTERSILSNASPADRKSVV